MKKRILYIQPNAGIGGSFQSLFVLLQMLDRSKYTPTVLFPSKNQIVIDMLSQINVDTVVHHFPSMGNSFNLKYKLRIGHFLNNMFKKFPFKSSAFVYPGFLSICYGMLIVFDFIRFYLKKASVINKIPGLSVDLVHINSLVGLFGYYYAKKHGYPVVWHIREQLPKISSSFLRNFYSDIFIDPCIKHLICISENEARPFTNAKIKIIYNFYKLDQQPVPAGKQIRFLAMGSLTEDKGFRLLVNAVRHLAKTYSHEDFKVNIMGFNSKKRMPDEKNHESFLKQICSLNIQKYFKRLEPTPHVPPSFFSNFHVLIRPSLNNDPWGRDIIEAMSTGRPVIATGYYDKFVKNEVNGFLIKTHDHLSLSNTMKKFIDNKELIHQFSQNSFQLASKLFNPSQNTKQIENLYDRIVR
ncbi:MAG: glycosyltransferase family 4 protein [Desulfobacterales bacterium]|jgi:glycosyltransferase involved in cell wall biosynthesis